MKGKLYGVGVGPGDPELLTLKALRLIRENPVIAVPGEDIRASVAYQIVKGAYEALDEKTLLPVAMPMTKDPAVLEANHEKAAGDVEAYLRQGKNVVFLTLGDPTVYSTYLYVHKRILARGYEAEIVSGITSFCAVAARLNMGLVERDEPLHVIPATYQADGMDQVLKLPGTKVLMKTGRKMAQVRESIQKSGQQAVMIENCGMPGERIFEGAEQRRRQRVGVLQAGVRVGVSGIDIAGAGGIGHGPGIIRAAGRGLRLRGLRRHRRCRRRHLAGGHRQAARTAAACQQRGRKQAGRDENSAVFHIFLPFYGHIPQKSFFLCLYHSTLCTKKKGSGRPPGTFYNADEIWTNLAAGLRFRAQRYCPRPDLF